MDDISFPLSVKVGEETLDCVFHVKDELTKHMCINLFSDEGIPLPPESLVRLVDDRDPEEPKGKPIKAFVASTGDGKTYVFFMGIIAGVNALGKENFIRRKRLMIFSSSVKATIPTVWNIEDGGEVNRALVDQAYRLLVTETETFTDEEYRKYVMVYKSAMDNIHENLMGKNKEDNRQLLREFKAIERYFGMSNEYQIFLKTWFQNIDAYESAREKKGEIDSLIEKIRTSDSRLRRMIRKYIIDSLHQNGFDNPDGDTVLRYIDSDRNLDFLKTIYPESRLPEKLIVFMTTSKLFNSVIPISYRADFLYLLPCAKDGVVVIDESDQAYKVLRQACIESVGEPYDYLSMICTLWFCFQGKSTLDSLLEFIDIKKTDIRESDLDLLKTFYEGRGFIDGLYPQLESLVGTYLFDYRKFVSDQSGEKGSFLNNFFMFHSYKTVTTIRDKEKRFAVVEPQKTNKRLLFKYQETKPDDAYRLQGFIDLIIRTTDFAYYFLEQLSRCILKHELMEGLKGQSVKDTYEDTVHKVLVALMRNVMEVASKRFGKTIFERLVYEKSFLARKEGVLKTFPSLLEMDTSLASTGYRFNYADATESFRRIHNIRLLNTRVNKTPESLILALSKRMKVILMSATADFRCLIRNFNLEHLERKTGYVLLPPKEERDEIARCHERKTAGNDNVAVNIIDMDFNKKIYSENSEARWKENFQSFENRLQAVTGPYAQLVSTCNVFIPNCKFKDLTKRERTQVFLTLRVLNFVEFVISYLSRFNEGICPFALYYSNKVFSDPGAGHKGRNVIPTDIQSLENIYKIINIYLERNPVRFKDRKLLHPETGKPLVAQDFIFSANADQLVDKKRMIQDNIDNGLPCVLTTSFNSGCVGQNFQMYVPTDTYMKQLVRIGTEREPDIRVREYTPFGKKARRRTVKNADEKEKKEFIRVNLPMLGMEKPTNVIFNFRDEEWAQLSAENRVEQCCNALFDILSISDAKELLPKYESYLIGDILTRLSGTTRVRDEIGSVLEDDDDEESGFTLSSVLRSTDTVIASDTLLAIQAIGRFPRECMKFRQEFIHAAADLKVVRAWEDDRLLTYEFSKFFEKREYIREMPVELTKAVGIARRAKQIIRDVVSGLRHSPQNNYLYETLKDFVVKHFFISEKMKEYSPYGALYIDAMKEDGYWVKFYEDRDFEVEAISIAGPKDGGYMRLDMDVSRLRQMLEVPGFREYLQERGMPLEYEDQSYILCPYAVISLFVGTIGELFAEFIFRKTFDNGEVRLERFGGFDTDDYKIFEFLDYWIIRGDGEKRVALDVKNWSGRVNPERTTDAVLEKSLPKIVTAGVRKVVYAQCIGDEYTTLDRITSEDGVTVEILEVDGLAKNGRINYGCMQAIMKFLNN